MNQPECMKKYCILGSETTYKSNTAPNNCLFHIVRMEMSNSQDAQITNKGKIYTNRHIYAHTVHISFTSYAFESTNVVTQNRRWKKKHCNIYVGYK